VLSLAEDEEAVCIAATNKFVVALTSKNLARVLSLSGVQTDIFRISGSPVCVVSSANRLSITTLLDGGQLWYELLRMSDFGDTERLLSSGPLPLSPGATLEWMGFSETDELMCYDSDGVLLRLDCWGSVDRWRVICDNPAKSFNANFFWVTSVTKNSVVGVPCPGTERYPSAVPRPTLQPCEFNVPVLEKSETSAKLLISRSEFAKSVMEYDRVKASPDSPVDQVDEMQNEMMTAKINVDKAILRLFEEACRGNRAIRALDLASRLQIDKSSEIAFRVASHFKMSNLTQRLEVIIEVKKRARELRHQKEMERSTHAIGIHSTNDLPGSSTLDRSPDCVKTFENSEPFHSMKAPTRPRSSATMDENSTDTDLRMSPAKGVGPAESSGGSCSKNDGGQNKGAMEPSAVRIPRRSIAVNPFAKK